MYLASSYKAPIKPAGSLTKGPSQSPVRLSWGKKRSPETLPEGIYPACQNDDAYMEGLHTLSPPYIYIYTYIHIHICTYTCIYISVSIHICIHIFIYTCTCRSTYISVPISCIHLYMHARRCLYIYMYTAISIPVLILYACMHIYVYV